ncbi:hypothetical protein CONPUDRAFT_93538 [Coniophora puteana RWD-64-598 SS2]|uniref:Uncharacterized protein n=1 Tax=Coniophora puteana (strain RWD-64-598) TaxID=741705 RepID=A0A5M3M8V8_CONPW|nr:uncharacterized protein CONPUDRAFT_93538 [Coniophora puteana RWD-64-598 SS2]EIW75274.1 hypothetical protein CONPUDRAFT_93538 [Coniophora puteana RWD-64-598 SS2]
MAQDGPQPGWKGLLGAEATKFVGQETHDIHLTDFFGEDGRNRVRQAGHCIAPFVTTLIWQETPPPATPDMSNVWTPTNEPSGDFTLTIQGMNLPIQNLNPPTIQVNQPAWLHMGAQMPGIVNVGGVAQTGYLLPWFTKIRVDYHPEGQARNLHYYKHEARTSHMQPPRYKIVNPVHREIEALEYGTHVQAYRRAIRR